ncbi:MAG: metal-dependent hydrolase [Hydrogenophaga sp.]|uniref:metal-dependent hydrolase n=1 Tax=Hydrogenophaga sp. TaxID=1904254 RepID=UPI0025B9E42B|nr:metal-dependent hydrolase [Hydrogenophaga sp.]MBT9552183.1 metal-dependent hydrolase [Hydrogenophaga sp.]
MATYLHFAPAIALAVAAGVQRVGWRLTLAGACFAVLPDADFALVTLGLDRYNGPYGHRGFTHSIAFALALGAFGSLWAGPGWRRRLGAATFLALCTLSHPVLDGLLDRGICSAWLWPLDDARLCLDWRPVPMRGVPLFGMERFRQELLWIGLPLLLITNAVLLLRAGWHSVRSLRINGSTPCATQG